MKTLLVHAPGVIDTTSYYRGLGPLLALEQQCPNLRLLATREYSWATFHQADYFFIQRPYRQAHEDVILMAKANRVPVWVDHDDDLFAVPADSPAHDTYAGDDVKKCIARCVVHADLVTASTPRLAMRLETLARQSVVVLPNAWNDLRADRRQAVPELRRSGVAAPPARTVLWRGSNTHQKDLAVFSPQILDVARRHPELHWTFVGWNPWFITGCLPADRWTYVPTMDINEYMEFLRGVRAAFHVVPLHDNELNRAKSNIAWIEATQAGSAVLAPCWPEWRRPGVTTYDGPADFGDKLEAMLAEPEDRLRQWNLMSWDHICDQLLLQDVNRQRVVLLDRLTAGGPQRRSVADLSSRT